MSTDLKLLQDIRERLRLQAVEASTGPLIQTAADLFEAVLSLDRVIRLVRGSNDA